MKREEEKNWVKKEGRRAHEGGGRGKSGEKRGGGCIKGEEEESREKVSVGEPSAPSIFLRFFLPIAPPPFYAPAAQATVFFYGLLTE